LGLQLESNDKITKKIDKEKELYFVGVLPSFFNNILDTKFTEAIIKPPPNKWAWLEPYVPWIIAGTVLITVLFLVSG